MVLHGICSLFVIDGQGYNITGLEHTFCDTSDMTNLVTEHFNGIFYHKFTIRAGDDTGIGMLTTAGSIEWCFFHKDGTNLSVGQCFGNFCFCSHNCDPGITNILFITNKSGGNGRINRFVYGYICTHVIGFFSCTSCFHTLLFHTCGEAFFVDGNSFFHEDFFGQIQWESVGIVKLKCIFAG